MIPDHTNAGSPARASSPASLKCAAPSYASLADAIRKVLQR
jgi:hypothetical protein